ncbi:MAG TPA: glycosyltransferase family 4 protein [Actinomycetota bacterium]|nr:glycosyltransferase family 4 protein [Actinomycetota bacterium]
MYAANAQKEGRIIAPADASAVESGYLQVTGWALTDPPVSRVDVTVDEKVAGSALIGLPAPSEQAYRRESQAPICGFEFELDLAQFVTPGDPVRIGATVVAVNGSTYRLNEVHLTTVAPGDGKELSFDFLPSARPVHQGEGPMKVAIVANDLLLGGSQLRLLEVLANLTSDPRFAFTVFSPLDGPLRPELLSLGIKVKICPAFSYSSAGGYTEAASGLARELAGGGYRLVWASTLISFIGIEAARLAGLPSLQLIQQNQDVPVFWGHALANGEIDPVVARRAQRLCALADRLVVVCEASRRTYGRYGNDGKIAVVQNAIDLEAIDRYRAATSRAEARRSLGVGDGETLVLCCGVIAPHKGQTTLAQAFASVAERHPDAVLTLVHEIGNRYTAGLKAYLERAGLGDRVRVLPLADDVYRWYRAADLAICPSQEEAQPSVVLEAMAFGVPVASTTVGGVTEVVEDGVTGLLCRPGDLSAMAAMLDRALSLSSSEREAIVAAARARVDRNHDVRRASMQYLAVLEELTGAGPLPEDQARPQVEVELERGRAAIAEFRSWAKELQEAVRYHHDRANASEALGARLVAERDVAQTEVARLAPLEKKLDAATREIEAIHHSKAWRVFNLIWAARRTADRLVAPVRNRLSRLASRPPAATTAAGAAAAGAGAEQELGASAARLIEKLPERFPAGNGRPVLLCLPWFVTGGADRVVEYLLGHWRAGGRTVVVITTTPLGVNMESRFDDLLGLTPFAYDLNHMAPAASWLPFVEELLDRLGNPTILNIGSGWLYSNLERLLASRPGIRVVDQQFNDVGHLTSNRKVRSHVDLTVAAHRALAEVVRSDGRDPGRVVTAYVGIPAPPRATDEQLAGLRAELGVAPGTKVVLFIGRFSEEKRPEWVVALAAVLAGDDVAVVMVGTGPEEAELRKGIEALPGVTWRRYVENIGAFIGLADVLVLPSRTEGIPLTVMEALSLGTPVVATRVGGLGELDGIPGFRLCEPDDFPGFVTAVRETLGSAPAEGIALPAHFGVEHMVETYDRIVDGTELNPRSPQTAGVGA